MNLGLKSGENKRKTEEMGGSKMNGINIKDSTVLLKYVRFDIDFSKKKN